MEGYNCNFFEGGKSYILVLFNCIIIYDPHNKISQGDKFLPHDTPLLPMSLLKL